jgi:branched-subunit amino acid ABC-type transport system permease component
VTLGGLMAYVGTQMLHMPLIASAIFAIVIGALTGFIQNEIVWGPLRRRHVGTMQQMIVTIGLSMALQYTFQFFFGGDIKGIVKSVPDSFQLGPITTDMPTLLKAAIEQNFVPVVDDRNVFIGMVRRTVLLRELYDKYTTLPTDKRFKDSHPPM